MVGDRGLLRLGLFCNPSEFLTWDSALLSFDNTMDPRPTCGPGVCVFRKRCGTLSYARSRMPFSLTAAILCTGWLDVILRRLSAVQATQDGVVCGIGVVFRMDTHGPSTHPSRLVATSGHHSPSHLPRCAACQLGYRIRPPLTACTPPVQPFSFRHPSRAQHIQPGPPALRRRCPILHFLWGNLLITRPA